MSLLRYVAAWIIVGTGAAFAQASPGFVADSQLHAAALNSAFQATVATNNGAASNLTITGTSTFSGSTLSLTGAANLTTFQTTSGSPLAVVANTPLEGSYLTGGGSLVAMCPGYNFGCPATGQIMAQQANVMTTLGGAGAQESGFYQYLVDQTGYAPAWVASTGYTMNAQVNTGTYTYIQTQATCVSASSGSGPSGTGTGIVDNTCRGNELGEYGLLGKIAIAGTVLSLPGGAASWAGDFDNFFYSGWAAQFGTGVEIDVTNNSGLDATGGTHTIDDLYLGGSVGTNPITAYISMSPFGLNGTNFMAHEGLYIQGPYTIAGHDIRLSTGSLAGIFNDASANHGTAFILDTGTSPNGILLNGDYTTGVALVSNATLQAIATVNGADFTGLNITNSGTTTTTTDSNIIMNTGNTNSYGRIDLFDSHGWNFQSGSAVSGGITIGTLAGPINLNPTTTIMVNSVAGVSCAANSVSLTTLTVTDGLVTHC